MIQYLPAQIESFTRTYPEVQILLREEMSENVLQSLIDGMADIGIVDGAIGGIAGIVGLSLLFLSPGRVHGRGVWSGHHVIRWCQVRR